MRSYLHSRIRLIPYAAGTVLLLAMLTGCQTKNLRDSWRYMKPNIDTIPVPTVDMTALKAKHPDADKVYLGINIRARDEGLRYPNRTFHTLRAHRYVVMDEHSEDATTISENFDESVTIRQADAYVWNPDGTTAVYETDDFIYASEGEDSHSAKLPIKDLQEGSIIDYSFHLSTPTAAQFNRYEPIRLQWYSPIELLEVQLEFLSDEKVTYRDLPEWADGSIKSYPVHDGKAVGFKVTDVPAYINEPYSPSRAYMGNYFEYAVSSSAMGLDKTGNEFWEELRERYFKSGLDRVDELDIEDEDEILEDYPKMVKGANARDSIQSMFDWIRERVSINTRANYTDPDDAYEDRSSDVEGFYSLLKGIVQHAGYKATVVRMHNKTRGEFDDEFYNIDQFAEYGMMIEAGDEQFHTIPHRTTLPVDIVPVDYLRQPGMIVDRDDGPVLKKLENPTQRPWKRTRDIDITVNDDGSVEVTAIDTTFGSAAYERRVNYQNMPDEERESAIKEFLVFDQGEVSDVKIEVFNLDDVTLPFVRTATYTIPEGATITPEEVLFQTEGLISSKSETDTEEDPDKRQNPVYIARDYESIRRVNINYPSSWKLSSKVDQVRNTNELGTLTRKVNNQGSNLTINTVSYMNEGYWPKERAKDLYEIYGDGVLESIGTIVFTIN